MANHDGVIAGFAHTLTNRGSMRFFCTGITFEAHTAGCSQQQLELQLVCIKIHSPLQTS